MLVLAGTLVYILICFLLLFVVLMQQGKGGDIAAAFGGSSSQTAFGARSGANFLTRATAWLGAAFMIGAFLLTAAGRSTTGGSVVSGVEGPAQTTPALPTGAPLPAPPAGGAGSGSGTPPATPPAGTGSSGSGSTQTPPAQGGTGS